MNKDCYYQLVNDALDGDKFAQFIIRKLLDIETKKMLRMVDDNMFLSLQNSHIFSTLLNEYAQRPPF